MLQVNLAKTYAESLNDLIFEYRVENNNQPFSMQDVAVWAVNNRKWAPQPRSLTRELARHLSKAAKIQHHTDPQGRKKVRTYHAAKFEKINKKRQRIFRVIWDYIYSMSLDHAHVSFNQRRAQLSGGCKSLDTDINSFNDNNPNALGNEIQMSFDFTFEVATQHEQVVEQIIPDGPSVIATSGRVKAK